MSECHVAVLVLAAGGSSRMGQPKQLLLWKGRTLLQHVVDAVGRSSADEIVVVLGSASEEVQMRLDLPAHTQVVVNPGFMRGQATSLQAGLRACSPRCQAAVVVLGDQPELPSDLIDLVVRKWRDTGIPIVRCVFDGSPGHPVLLARDMWNHLPEDGDEGAKSLIRDRPDLVDEVNLPYPPAGDIDTPDDYRILRG